MAVYATKELSTESVGESWLIEPMIEVLMTLEERTTWTWRHLGAVARYAVTFGRELHLSYEEMLSLQCAAILHDAGKPQVSAEILNKSEPLDRDEWYSITKQPIATRKALSERTLPTGVVSTAQCHHEHYDGSGYPMGLAGDTIPLTARILSLADACDTMLSERPYRSAMKPAQVLVEIANAAGKQFDPVLVRILRPLIEQGMATKQPTKRLRVVSDDPSIYRQLWFAAQPNGWELEAWPMAWEGFCPPEMRCDEWNDSEDAFESSGRTLPPVVTIVDGRCVGRLSTETLHHIPDDAIWIDPPHITPLTLQTPLDIRDVLGFLNGEEMMTRELSPSAKIRVVIADPYHLFRQVLRRCLDERNDVEVVAEVSTPTAYREAIARHKFDVAILASDLLADTRTSALLKAGDIRLRKEEIITEPLSSQPTIVLVADEDIDSYDVALYDAPLTGASQDVKRNCVYVHRGAPAERLVEAMKSMMRET